jgi:uncharacterized membrane protein YdjX (TVP38/TMEM64 family)/rhodanese-related sulfurtransferase
MRSGWSRVVVLVVVLTGLALSIRYREHINTDVLEQWVTELGVVGPVGFLFVYAIGVLFFLPGSLLTLTGGAIFGPILGTFINLTGATLGAIGAFLISRYVGSRWIEEKIGGKLVKLQNNVEAEGWRFVAFVRLVPLFPFNLLNYALGLTRIKLVHYIIASYICMLPGAIAYTYLGYAGREAVAGSQDLVQKILLALGLLGAVVFLPRLVGRLRQKTRIEVSEVKRRLDNNEKFLLLDVRAQDELAGEQGQISGAINIPINELKGRLSELSAYRESPIAIICRTDQRSSRAAELLSLEGFSDIQVVKGGMIDWNKEGYQVS